MSKHWFVIFLVAGGLSACAPLNTHFSCNETANDKCLTIEEVNAMTENDTAPPNSPIQIWVPKDNKDK